MWFKVDDSFYSNPKTAMLSDGATALWLRSGSWSAQQLTGGFVPARIVPMFRGSDDSVRELCDAGLWVYDEQKDGYRFHDWSDYQPDGEEVDALRRKRSEAGKRGANRRWGKPENGKNGKTDGKCHGKPMASRWQTHAPFPYPYPIRKRKKNILLLSPKKAVSAISSWRGRRPTPTPISSAIIRTSTYRTHGTHSIHDITAKHTPSTSGRACGKAGANAEPT